MRRAVTVAGVLVFTIILPLVMTGALLAADGEQTSPSKRALGEIPRELLSVYVAAAASCEGLDWTILAAIHRVETNFGTGPAISSAGAQGPMQFMPATFRSYGVDGNGDGAVEVNDPVDAIFSAANLLCANGGGDPARLADAIWTYNHSDAYVAEVLRLATAYGVVRFAAGGAYASPQQLLGNPRIALSTNARADVAAGLVDPRLISLLQVLSARHTLSVSVFKSGHSMYTRSGSVSNHYYGRAADIFYVDGVEVSSSSLPSRRLVAEISVIRGPFRPTEVGHPFARMSFGGGFSDGDHLDHVHIGYD